MPKPENFLQRYPGILDESAPANPIIIAEHPVRKSGPFDNVPDKRGPWNPHNPAGVSHANTGSKRAWKLS